MLFGVSVVCVLIVSCGVNGWRGDGALTVVAFVGAVSVVGTSDVGASSVGGGVGGFVGCIGVCVGVGVAIVVGASDGGGAVCMAVNA